MKQTSPKSAALLLMTLVASGVFAAIAAGQQIRPMPPMRPIAPAPVIRDVAQPPPDCAHHPDADGDGVNDIACGGTDCADHDAARYPGRPETCEIDLSSGRPNATYAAHDEDCDPMTVAQPTRSFNADGDHDQDGFISAACTNPYPSPNAPGRNSSVLVDLGRHIVQGTDCDDSNPSIVPGAQICGGAGVLVCASAAQHADTANGYVTRRCGTAERCISQPNGLGVCSP